MVISSIIGWLPFSQQKCHFVKNLLTRYMAQQQNLGRRFGTSKMHLSPPPPPPRWLRLLSSVLRRCNGYVAVDLLFIVTHTVGFCNCFLFCCKFLYVPSSFAIILMGKRELVALLSLSSWCLVIVVWLVG